MFLPSNITLQFGDSGDFVSELQRRLAAINVHSGDAVSGMYDGMTVNSVSSFQARSGLRADGIAGPETLRKLNGIISGDTGSSDKKEEDATKQLTQDALVQAELIAAHQPVIEPMQERRNLEERRPDPVAIEPAYYAPAPAPQPTGPSPDQIQQQLTRDMQMQHEQQPQQHQPASGDSLAHMLLSKTPQSEPQHHAAGHAAPDTASAGHHAPAQTAPHQPATDAAAHQAASAEQPRGLVGRAMQKIDSFVQKMAEYFEAKLPPDVLREVKQIGEIMAKSGVKEAAIPTGPDQVRSQALPSRGPEQQAAQMPHRP